MGTSTPPDHSTVQPRAIAIVDVVITEDCRPLMPIRLVIYLLEQKYCSADVAPHWQDALFKIRAVQRNTGRDGDRIDLFPELERILSRGRSSVPSTGFAVCLVTTIDASIP